VLLSQAVAAGFVTAFHLKYRNVDLFDLKGLDARISAAIIGFGVVEWWPRSRLPSASLPIYVKAYIGLLVVAMEVLLIARPRVRFSWPRLYAVSIVNGFDKAISGGGFGPVVVGGLLTLGKTLRNSVGIVVFTVTVVNFAGVVLYLLSSAVGSTELYLMATLSIGRNVGSVIGPSITRRLNAKGHVSGLAFLMMAIGAISLVTPFVKV
jgi:uncharacterized protein